MGLFRMDPENSGMLELHRIQSFPSLSPFPSVGAVLFCLIQTTSRRRHATYAFWLRKDWKGAKKESTKRKMSAIVWLKRARKGSLSLILTQTVIKQPERKEIIVRPTRLLVRWTNVRAIRKDAFYFVIFLFLPGRYYSSSRIPVNKWVTFILRIKKYFVLRRAGENFSISVHFDTRPRWPYLAHRRSAKPLFYPRML